MPFHLLSVQFCNYAVLCHTTIFDSDCIVLSKNFIHEMVRVIVVMTIDYPILCGPCTNINILLFSGNNNNISTCHLLYVLNCRWSRSLWQMYSYELLVSAKCAAWKKMVLKFGMIYTKSTILCKRTLRLVKKKYWISRLVLDKQKSRKFVILE
jgi:hypothetical protein